MELVRLNDGQLEEYYDLAESLGSVFNQRRWCESLVGLTPLGLVDKKGKLVGGITVREVRRFGLKILRGVPYSSFAGPFVKIGSPHPVQIMEGRRDAIQAVVDYAKQNKFAVVSLPIDCTYNDMLPFIWDGYKVIVRYTYRMDLRRSDDDILKGMSSSGRWRVNKAIKDGVECRQILDYNDVFNLVAKVYERNSNVSFDVGATKDILFKFADSINSFSFGSYIDGKLSSVTFLVHDGKTCYSVLGGYDPSNKHQGAGPLAELEAMKYAKSIGLECYDFEGSILPSIESFNRQLGATLTPYYVACKAWFPIEMICKIIRRTMF